MSDQCPVPPPKLLKATSLVETCGSCGAWVERYPEFVGNEIEWQCDKCGATWVNVRQGRPYGPKSKQWELVTEWFNDLYLDIHPDEWDTVTTDPPMESLDWQAIEAWYRSQNIYRMHISIGRIEVSYETSE